MPEPPGPDDPPGDPRTVELPDEPFVFLAEGDALHAVDVGDPSAPAIAGSAADPSLGRVNGWTRYRDTSVRSTCASAGGSAPPTTPPAVAGTSSSRTRARAPIPRGDS